MMRLYRGDGAASVRSVFTNEALYGAESHMILQRRRELLFEVAWRESDFQLARELLGSWGDGEQDGPSPLFLKFANAKLRAMEVGAESSRDDFREVLTVIEPIHLNNPDVLDLKLAVAECHAWLGNSDKAAELAADLIASRGDRYGADENIWVPAIFDVLLVAKQTDAFIDELDNFLSSPGSRSIESLLRDPRLDYLRNDPRFQEVVDRHRRSAT